MALEGLTVNQKMKLEILVFLNQILLEAPSLKKETFHSDLYDYVCSSTEPYPFS